MDVVKKFWSKECDAQTNQTLFGEMILLVNLQNRMFFPKKVKKSPWKHNPSNQKWYGLLFEPTKSPTFRTPSKTKTARFHGSPMGVSHPKTPEVKEGKTLFLCVPCVVGQPRRLSAVQNFEMPKKHEAHAVPNTGHVRRRTP